MFGRIAIVNRGEAAMRLINAVRELRYERRVDLRTIALHVAAERSAMFVREADEAVCIDTDRDPGAGSPYLDIETLGAALVGGARRRGVGRAGDSSPSVPSSPTCATTSASCSSARDRT